MFHTNIDILDEMKNDLKLLEYTSNLPHESDWLIATKPQQFFVDNSISNTQYFTIAWNYKLPKTVYERKICA